MYPNNNNNNDNNNNNNNIIIIIKREKSMKMGERGIAWRERGERVLIFYFSSLCFFLRSTKIGSQVFVGAEGKVDLRDEIYAWTPKS